MAEKDPQHEPTDKDGANGSQQPGDDESTDPGDGGRADVDEPQQADPTGQTTLVPDDNETLIPEDGLGATVNLDSTLVNGRDSDVDVYATADADPSKKTVAASEIDQTIQLDTDDPSQSTRPALEDSAGATSGKSVVSVGRGNASEPGEKTRAGSQEDTKADLTQEGRERETVQADGESLMTSGKIEETINPRELSDKDAEFWGSLSMERDSKQDPSYLPPAVDRSLTESKLQIRSRHVATPKSDPSEPSDYRLVRLLGKGGMGNVYVARQRSLDRLLAVKVIKPLSRSKRDKLRETGRLESVQRDRRQQFLSEAVVTGDLDHPNIVPIHDIAVTADNTLFYSMKRVIGEPWSKLIKSKSLDDNLDILLKAADAVGFAHTRGVVHRDIKPENIMLGDFGVVMVMDWGLALATTGFEKIESIFPATGLGGSPAFMAPEMATGPVDRIGPPADIYLLGSTLFFVITGKAPHSATNVSLCLKAAAQNEIRPVDPKFDGELMDIALKAMSTRSQDRYPDVESFQNAIKEYRTHKHSIDLRHLASEHLEQGKVTGDYEDFEKASASFEQAITLWESNEEAHAGLAETKLAYAEAAYHKGDFGLGQLKLSEDAPEHQVLLKKLSDGAKQRDSRKKLVRGLQLAAAAMLAIILIGGAIATAVIYEQRNIAMKAEGVARKAEGVARTAEGVAKDKKAETEKALEEKGIALEAEEVARKAADKALEEKGIALKAEEVAREAADKAKEEALESEAATKEALIAEAKAKDEALEATARAEYEEFVSKIGLAKARIEKNEFKNARKILRDVKTKIEADGKSTGWEWRWLWSQANQSDKPVPTTAAALDLSMAASGKRAVATLANETLAIVDIVETGAAESAGPIDAKSISAAAISPDERTIAAATVGGVIQLWDLQTNSTWKQRDDTLTAPASGLAGATLRRPADYQGRRINDLKFTPGGLLVSASDDRTARLWNPDKPELLATCWHIAPVVQVDVVPIGSKLMLAAVVADESSGKAVIWDVTKRGGDQWDVKRNADFLQHESPVSSIALARNGTLAATADTSGNVWLWKPDEADPINYNDSITAAVNKIRKSGVKRSAPSRKKTPYRTLSDPDLSPSKTTFVSTGAPDVDERPAHADAVRTVRFNRDGTLLLTGSDDYTVKIWKVSKTQDDSSGKLVKSAGSLTTTLQGHGGWVTGADFVHGNSERILSASNDATVRSWNTKRYLAASITAPPEEKSPDDLEVQPHDDAVWSARFSPDGTHIVSASRDHTARVLKINSETMAIEHVVNLQDKEESRKNDFKQDGLLSEGSPFVAMSLAVDQKNDLLYVGSADSVVRVWDMNRGTQLSEVIASGLNDSLAISKTGRLMLTGSSDPNVKANLWQLGPNGQAKVKDQYITRVGWVKPGETKPARRAQEIDQFMGHHQAVTAFAISDDETKLFTGDSAGFGILWDAKTRQRIGKPINAVRGFRINAASFHSNGRELLIASDNQQLTRYDLTTRKVVRSMGHEGLVTRLSVSKDDRYALTISEQVLTFREPKKRETRLVSAVTLWDIRSGEGRLLGDKINLPIERKARFTSADFGDGERTAVISQSGADGAAAKLEFWQIGQSVNHAEISRTLTLPRRLGPAASAVPLGDQTLVTLNGEAAFRWNLSDNQVKKSYRAHAAVTQASFSWDGEYIVTGSRSVKVWNAKTGEALGKIENAHRGPVRSVQFQQAKGSQQGSYLFVTGGDDGTARTWTWDADSKKKKIIEKDPDQYKSDVAGTQVLSVCLSPDGKKLLAVGSGGYIRLWDRDQLGSVTKYGIHQTAQETDDETVSKSAVTLRCCAFSSDGEYFAVGGDDGFARMWKVVDQGEKIPEPIAFIGHADTVEDIAFLEEGVVPKNGPPMPMRLLTASRDESARVWDPQIRPEGTDKENPDQKDDADKAKQGRELVSLRRHTKGVTAVDASRDGRLVVTAGSDRAVILWPATVEPLPDK